MKGMDSTHSFSVVTYFKFRRSGAFAAIVPKWYRDKDEKDYDPNDYLACVIHPRPPRLHSASEVRLEDRFLFLFPLS